MVYTILHHGGVVAATQLVELERTPGKVAVSATYRMGPGSARVVDLGLIYCPEIIRVLPKQILGVWGQSPQWSVRNRG